METNYLIIGASHAGLSSLDAIRKVDPDTGIMMVTADNEELYSPTTMPYVVSGKTSGKFAALRDENYFSDKNVTLVKGVVVTGLDTEKNSVTVNDNQQISYDKLLIATGASAKIPPIPGLDTVDFCSIRTIADANKISEQAAKAKSAVVIGAGFIGMHAAENLAQDGLDVTVVEVLDRIMPASFDTDAAGMIRDVFTENGIAILTGQKILSVSNQDGQASLELADSQAIACDMLVIAAGIQPNTQFLEKSAIDGTFGIEVDRRMRTGVPNIWAAGDVALAPDFFNDHKNIAGTIPCASRQGEIAGMDMAGDEYASDYTGNLSMNTFNFFGNFAFSIGNVSQESFDEAYEIHTAKGQPQGSFVKLVFQDAFLTGVSAINRRLDPGILKELIHRKIDLSGKKEKFIQAPLETGRQLMRELF